LLLSLVIAPVLAIGLSVNTRAAAIGDPAAASANVSVPTAASTLNPLCAVNPAACAVANKAKDLASKAGGAAVSGVVDSGVQKLASAMAGGWDSIMKKLLTAWLNQGLLVPLDGASVTWLTDSLHGISVALAIIGVMFACVWTMFNMRGDRMKQAAEALFKVFLVTTVGTALVQVLIPAGDQFGKWILESAGVTTNGWQTTATAHIISTMPGLAIIAGAIGIISTIINWALLVARMVVMPLFIAVWPTSAAAGILKGGEPGGGVITRWLIAALLYKPAAAIVYAFAWKMKSSDDVASVINGLLLVILAVIALPALVRMIAPAASAFGAMAGGSMALSITGAAVGAGVAAGAAVVTGGASAGAGTGASAGGSSAGASGVAAGTTPGPTGGSGGGGVPDAPAGGSGGGTSPGAPGAPGSDGASGANGSAGSAGAAGSSGAAEGTKSDGLQAAGQSLGGSLAAGGSSGSDEGDECIGESK